MSLMIRKTMMIRMRIVTEDEEEEEVGDDH